LILENLQVSISISVIKKTPDLMEKCGAGSASSEAYEGEWEGLG